jgi:Xaa-Pro aminopeptidase
MSDRMVRRRERLARCLTDEGLDLLLVTKPVHVTYLTGFTGDSTALILAAGRELLVSDARYTEQLAEECPGLEAVIRPPTQKLPNAIAQALGKLGGRSVGFESAALSVAEFEHLRELAPELDWKGSDDRVERLRQVKDEDEVEEIRYAVAVAERAFMAFMSFLRAADSERDLADAMEHYLRRAGGRGAAFPPIIAGGDRAALPHAPPIDRPAGIGDMLLIDWGAIGRLYRSDLTRVLDARTTPSFRTDERQSAKLDEVHAAVLEAQCRALRAIRPGVSALPSGTG